MNPQGAHFLQDDISHFDNSFFRITDKEASSIDPQQRILLECAYEAIESGMPYMPYVLINEIESR